MPTQMRLRYRRKAEAGEPPGLLLTNAGAIGEVNLEFGRRATGPGAAQITRSLPRILDHFTGDNSGQRDGASRARTAGVSLIHSGTVSLGRRRRHSLAGPASPIAKSEALLAESSCATSTVQLE